MSPLYTRTTKCIFFQKVFAKNERTPGDGYEEPEDVCDPHQDGIPGPGQQATIQSQSNGKPKLFPRRVPVDPVLETLKESIKQEIEVLNNKVCIM